MERAEFRRPTARSSRSAPYTRVMAAAPTDPMPSVAAALTTATPSGRAPVAVFRDGNEVVVASSPSAVVTAHGASAWTELDGVARRGGFWAVALSYELGASVERVPGRARDDRSFPDAVLVRFDHIERHRTARKPASSPGAAPVVGPMESSIDRRSHAAAVATIREHLVAGDCYQVNLTRRLHSPDAADPRALFAALTRQNPAPHASLLDLHDHPALPGFALVSASPERFLRIDGPLVETRPIKGTHRVAAALTTSTKDLAEHIMIVDLARNDLGRFAVPGSVRVPGLAEIEEHPGLAHLVSTVQARRDGASVVDVVRALFPAASITGAPKPRVLEIIDAIEPVRRGFYCGAIGWLDADTDRCDLAVAIRTFTVSHHGTDLGVGGGIVIDSDADAEWRETELKAARLLRAAGAGEAAATVSTR